MRWRERAYECSGLTWGEVREQLSGILNLRAKSDDRFVALSNSNADRFVQFAHDDNAESVRCEAVSNNFLTGSSRLTDSSVSALLALGWNMPTTKLPNFWRTYKRGTSEKTLASFAVRTMKEAFGIADTGSLYIDCGVFGTVTAAFASTLQRTVIPELKTGEVVVNLNARQTYRIEAPLGQGGFGATYRATVEGDSRSTDEVCLKIATEPEAWHREAYFGQLLNGAPRAIAVHDSFALVHGDPPTGPALLYCLVTELAVHGDLASYLQRRGAPWTESRARREVAALLRVLLRLHESGAVHRDLSASNVLVTEGEHLKLGDFGIARHRLGHRSVSADVFNPWFAPRSIVEGDTSSWQPADDVYQMGVILAMLLGTASENQPGSVDVKGLKCSSEVKAIIQRSIGDRRKRYTDARAMLAALELRDRGARRRRQIPRSLKGKRVVFTGALSALSRREAAALVERRGGRVQPKITSTTDILVEGSLSPAWKADEKGQKLLDRDREGERGHHIATIDEREFLALLD